MACCHAVPAGRSPAAVRKRGVRQEQRPLVEADGRFDVADDQDQVVDQWLPIPRATAIVFPRGRMDSRRSGSDAITTADFRDRGTLQRARRPAIPYARNANFDKRRSKT